jgi:hypothetical protein
MRAASATRPRDAYSKRNRLRTRVDARSRTGGAARGTRILSTKIDIRMRFSRVLAPSNTSSARRLAGGAAERSISPLQAAGRAPVREKSRGKLPQHCCSRRTAERDISRCPLLPSSRPCRRATGRCAQEPRRRSDMGGERPRAAAARACSIDGRDRIESDRGVRDTRAPHFRPRRRRTITGACDARLVSREAEHQRRRQAEGRGNASRGSRKAPPAPKPRGSANSCRRRWCAAACQTRSGGLVDHYPAMLRGRGGSGSCRDLDHGKRAADELSATRAKRGACCRMGVELSAW